MFSARGHPIDVVEERAPSITETLRVRPCVTQPSLGFSDGDDRAMAVGGNMQHETQGLGLPCIGTRVVGRRDSCTPAGPAHNRSSQPNGLDCRLVGRFFFSGRDPCTHPTRQ